MARIALVWLMVRLAAGCASERPRPSEPLRSIAVAAFEDRTGKLNGHVGAEAPRIFSDVLRGSGHFTVTDPYRVASTARDLKRTTLQELGRFLGVDYIATGTVQHQGAVRPHGSVYTWYEVVVEVRLTHVPTGEEFYSGSGRARILLPRGTTGVVRVEPHQAVQCLKEALSTLTDEIIAAAQ